MSPNLKKAIKGFGCAAVTLVLLSSAVASLLMYYFPPPGHYTARLHRCLSSDSFLRRYTALNTYADQVSTLSANDELAIIEYAVEDRFYEPLHWNVYSRICERFSGSLERPFVERATELIASEQETPSAKRERALENLLKGLTAMGSEYREYGVSLKQSDLPLSAAIEADRLADIYERRTGR